MEKFIWLIGAGLMAQEYAKVLKDLSVNFKVIGRGQDNAKEFSSKTHVDVVTGGLENFLLNKGPKCSHAIVAVSAENLFNVTKKLILNGINNILVEKPAAFTKENLLELKELSTLYSTNLLIAYNRRFYASTQKAIEIINNDGGVCSFNFEFTEWSHIIQTLNKKPEILSKWFLGNSTHVADLAFFLGGKPIEMSCYTQGSLSWHNSASVFAGAGKSDKGALFSYQANWSAPGRWSVEILTLYSRLIFKPLESLYVQEKGSIVVKEINLENENDKNYKPGLFKEVLSFISNDFSLFCTIDWQLELLDYYNRMANY